MVARAARRDGADGARCLREAASQAGRWLAARGHAARPGLDPSTGDAPAPIDVLRALTDQVEDAGALHVAGSLLEGLLIVTRDAPLEQGRLRAQAGRVARKLGHIDHAVELFRRTWRLAARFDSDELRVRAWIGLASVAQVKGNYPELERWSRRALLLAEQCGYVRLGAVARGGLFVRAARAKQFDAAIAEGWQILQDVAGDRTAEAEALSNLGQLALDMDQPAVACAAFATVFERTTAPRMILPALGGFAVASARLGDATALNWAVDQLSTLLKFPAAPYEAAMALMDAANAVGRAGCERESRLLRRSAKALARRDGYHEVMMTVELAPASPRRAVHDLSQAATQVFDGILTLAPADLPDRVLSSV
jgi:hypothetical protein